MNLRSEFQHFLKIHLINLISLQYSEADTRCYSYAYQWFYQISSIYHAFYLSPSFDPRVYFEIREYIERLPFEFKLEFLKKFETMKA